MKLRIAAAGVLLGMMVASQASLADDEFEENLAEAGDIVQLLLPASGYIGAWILGDKQGAAQLTKAIGGVVLVGHSLKFTTDRLRPDGTDSRSFPSGHTGAAYVGAEFIRVRYGNGWGIPAHIAAAFVGYSRIRAEKHFADDVLAGATNGMMWNWYFSSPYAEVIELQPVVMDGGYGVNFKYNMGTKVRFDEDWESRPRFKYSIEFGPVTQDKNLFQSPPDSGTVIDLATAEEELDMTSRVSFQHFFKPRHEWEAFIAPMELKEFDEAGVVPGPVNFAGQVFLPLPNTGFRTRYSQAELRAMYRYALVDSERWDVKLGGGLQYTTTALELVQYVGEPNEGNIVQSALAESSRVNVMGSARVGFNFSQKWSLQYELDAMLHGDSYLANALYLNWRVVPGWEFGLGARYADWEIDNDDIRNELQWGDVIIKVAHNFF